MRRPASRRDHSPGWRAEWEQQRASGMRYFIWSHGVLRWGGFMFFFSMAVFQYAHFGNVLSTQGNWPLRVLFGLVTWLFVGYGYGRSQWRRNEQAYLEQKKGSY